MELKLGREEREDLQVVRNREKVTGPMDQGSWSGGEMVEVETLEKGSWKTTSGEKRARCRGTEIQWSLVIAVTKFRVWVGSEWTR